MPICPTCGHPLHAGVADGMCTRCLLTGALSLREESDSTELESPATLLTKREFAGYELQGEIARGGMGVVFRAKQRKPARIVALKVIAAGELATPRMIERFRTEAGAAAQLDHPNIVPIYEVGHEGGWHFFSMRLIEGGTLADRVRGRGLPPREAASLVVSVARAVQHAHARGVLHRDLKPTNILVDTRGEPHLTDFGLAKLLESSVELTHSNAVLGTPAYMAPEQAAGGTRDVTLAADVYGAGAVLYQCLTGHPPFESDSAHTLLRRVFESDPVPPSVRKLKESSRQSSGGQPTAEHIPRDLDAICLKCLEKEPARRYRSMEALADDLQRWLNGEPVVARVSTRRERLWKWAQRKPALASLVAVAALSLVVIVAGSLRFNVQLARAKREAEEAAGSARSRLIAEHLREAARLTTEDDALQAVLPLVEALKLEGPDGTAARRLSATVGWSPRLMRLWSVADVPEALRFSGDGRRLIVSLRNGSVSGWDVVSGEPAAVPPGEDPPQRPDPQENLLSPDRNWQLSAAEGEYLLTNLSGTRPPLPLAVPGTCHATVFSPDSRLVAMASWGGQARVFTLPEGTPAVSPIRHESGANQVVFSPDGRLLATAGFDYRLRLWNTGNFRAAAPALQHNALIEAVAFSANARFLAAADATGVIKVWDLYAPAAVPVENGRLWLRSGFSRDGRLFATADDSGRIWLCDAASGQPVGTPLTLRPDTIRTMFDESGRFLSAWGRSNGGIRVWEVASRRVVLDLPNEHDIARVIIHPDGTRVIIVHRGSRIVQRRLADGSLIGELAEHPSDGGWSAISPDGRWLAVGGILGPSVCVYDTLTGRAAGPVIEGTDMVKQLNFSRDSRRLAVPFSKAGVEPSSAVVVSLPGLNTVLPALGHGDGVAAVLFSPNGSRIVTGGEDNVARVWNAADGQPAVPALRHEGIVDALDFTPDGRMLCTGSHDGMVRLWDPNRGELVAPPFTAGRPDTLAVSSSLPRLLTGSPETPALLLPLDELRLPAAAWEQLVMCLTGSRIESESGAVQCSAAELTAAFSRLWEDFPAHFAWPDSSAAWHRLHAGAGEGFVAEFHRAWTERFAR
jgi:WD40 repeat protein